MTEPEGGGFTVTTLACGHRDLGITRPFQCIHEYEKWRDDMSEAREDCDVEVRGDDWPGVHWCRTHKRTCSYKGCPTEPSEEARDDTRADAGSFDDDAAAWVRVTFTFEREPGMTEAELMEAAEQAYKDGDWNVDDHVLDMVAGVEMPRACAVCGKPFSEEPSGD